MQQSKCNYFFKILWCSNNQKVAGSIPTLATQKIGETESWRGGSSPPYHGRGALEQGRTPMLPGW